MQKTIKEYRSVKLTKSLVDQLHEIKHPGQSLNGFIQELVNEKVKK